MPHEKNARRHQACFTSDPALASGESRTREDRCIGISLLRISRHSYAQARPKSIQGHGWDEMFPPLFLLSLLVVYITHELHLG